MDLALCRVEAEAASERSMNPRSEADGEGRHLIVRVCEVSNVRRPSEGGRADIAEAGKGGVSGEELAEG